jgi:hypothetical protein
LPEHVETIPHLRGFYRDACDPVTLTAGDGRLQLPPIRQGYVAYLDLATVGGDAMGGATVTLYRNIVAYDTCLGTVTLGATDPAAVFTTDGGQPPVLRGGEALVADVTNAGTEAVLAAEFRLVELEERAWSPAPVPGSQAPLRVVVVGAELEPAGPPPIGDETEDER